MMYRGLTWNMVLWRSMSGTHVQCTNEGQVGYPQSGIRVLVMIATQRTHSQKNPIIRILQSWPRPRPQDSRVSFGGKTFKQKSILILCIYGLVREGVPNGESTGKRPIDDLAVCSDDGKRTRTDPPLLPCRRESLFLPLPPPPLPLWPFLVKG